MTFHLLKNIHLNKPTMYYFIVSWVLGGILFGMSFYDEEYWYFLVFFIFGFNFIINSLAIVILAVLFIVFTENRIEFFHSILLLLFNLPFLVGLYLLIDLI